MHRAERERIIKRLEKDIDDAERAILRRQKLRDDIVTELDKYEDMRSNWND